MTDPLDQIARICAEAPEDALSRIADVLGFKEQQAEPGAYERSQQIAVFLRLAEAVQADSKRTRDRYPAQSERADQLAAFMKTACKWAAQSGQRAATHPTLRLCRRDGKASDVHIHAVQRDEATGAFDVWVSTPEERGRQRAGVAEPGDVLRWAAGVVQLYDDATMAADYMIDANDVEGILKALGDYMDRAAAPTQQQEGGK